MKNRSRDWPGQRGFTLVELLVVLAIVAALLGMLVPALGRARTAARIVRVHSDLRQIELALLIYADNHAGALPPTRFSCSMRTAYELPGELSDYLPHDRTLVSTSAGDVVLDKIHMWDIFLPSETYKYRAVGAAIVNESVVFAPPDGAWLWVPDDFPPSCVEAGGRIHRDPRESPVRYALWSVGPDPRSPKLSHLPGRLPLPRRYWCHGAGDTGVITHFTARDGKQYSSP